MEPQTAPAPAEAVHAVPTRTTAAGRHSVPTQARPTRTSRMPHPTITLTGTEIAVLAVAGRFPGAATLAQFWANLRNGVESVHVFSDEELLAAGEDPSLLADPAYVRACPQLDGIDRFDAAFFGISPRDASVMDPQHRLFLEVAWEAMERAGYAGTAAPIATGVFAATGMNHYMLHHVVPNAEIMQTVGEWLARHTGNDMNFLATRAAYQMNLRGPAMNVQTACSSSITAIHMACQSLLARESDLALAGASTLALPQDRGYLYKPGEILSPDGHCRPFDAGAMGTLFGSGVGCVVLKRLQDALDDGDTVVAVIRGTAINNDGAHKVGYLAPSVDGQARVIAEALAVAGVEAESIGLIEAHGTGTAVGDPIEVAALTQAYAPLTSRRGFIALGSVKANIGHLGEAAGMAGVIKTVLALQHGELPPCANYTAPNPGIDFEASPFRVNATLMPWPRGAMPRRAGVTSLGAGGTNAHLILEEAPAPCAADPAPRVPQLLTVSARTAGALHTACAQLAESLEHDPAVSLPDAAWTLQHGRAAFRYRRTVVARTGTDAATALRASLDVVPPAITADGAPVIFMFPGGGAQYAGMGRELYETEPVYREAIDACLAEVPDALAHSLRQLMLAPASTAAAGMELSAPRVALPALFATEYATAQLLVSWGVTPAGMIGHSMGEYVAACLAGVFSLRDALMLVMERARLFSIVAAGGMLSVELSEDALRPLLDPALSIAAVNGPASCVASGPTHAIDALERSLHDRDIGATRVHITVAAHSALLDPILDEFRGVCARVRFAAPQVPVISNLTGTWITPAEAMSPDYWVRHLRETVRFGDGLQTVTDGGPCVLVEVGPGRTLCNFARGQAAHAPSQPTLRHARDTHASDVEFALGAVGRIWERGGNVEFAALHRGTRRRRIPLPTYPFERERFWLPAGGRPAAHPERETRVVRHAALRDWFEMTAWRRSALTADADGAQQGVWLVFADCGGVGAALASQRPEGTTVLVSRGDRFERHSPSSFVVRARHPEDIAAVFEALLLEERWPEQVVHLWAMDTPDVSLLDRIRRPNTASQLVHALDDYFTSQVSIVQAVAEQERPLTLSVVGSGIFSCSDHDALPDPMKAMVLGPVQVAPREVTHLASRCIDVALGTLPATALAARILAELQRPATDTAVALRPTARWVRTLQPVPLDAAPAGVAGIRARATILITGGLGGIGLIIAHHLAATVQARLVLVGRTALPERAEWDAIVRQGRTDRLGQQVRALQAIEAAGGEVLLATADVTDVVQMTGVVTMARARFGAIHGVIHAAGVIDDGLLSLKSASTALPVIAVKVLGAMVLDEVLRREPLEFFVAFSSISAVLGLEGQGDYTAANACLDAFIERKRRTSAVRAISIGWNAWRDVGMTAALADAALHAAARLTGAPGPHPELERVTHEHDGATRFSTVFSPARQWMLSEHLVRDGEALLPGTAYLELVRAAVDRAQGGPVTALDNVTFLAPFVVTRAAPRVLRLRLERESLTANGFREFAFTPDGSDEPAVTGRVARLADIPLPTDGLAAVRTRCGPPTPVGGAFPQPFMQFGPRWSVITHAAMAGEEALVHLTLPPEFHADLATYQLHPALLDMATGGAQRLIPGFDPSAHFYVPLRYERVRQFHPLTPTLYSHVRFDAANGGGDTARFDVDIYGTDGTVLVQIRGFTMKRVHAPAAIHPVAETHPAHVTSLATLQSLLATAIAPHEGVEAFDRVLASGLSGPILASSVDLPRWSAALASENSAGVAAQQRAEVSAPSFDRPSLGTSFVAPRTPLEQELSELWSQLLGVTSIGVHDDFFELGGQSLIAVRLFSRIRKRYRVDLPLSTLFEAPTIAQCATIIASETDVDAQSPGELLPAPDAHRPASLTPSSRWRSLVIMQPAGPRPAFACVAGMGGTLTNLRKLAALLGDSRPFYGLQPPGADDPEQLLYNVEELAAHYIAQLRREQPHGPYFLGGYSGGGVAAFEMARQLMAAGEAVAFLGFIDSFSPALPQRSLAERASIHARRAVTLGPGYLFDMVRRRLGSERNNLRLRMARQLGRVMPDAYRYDAVQDSWMVAERRYRPERLPLSGTLLRAREETAVSLWSGVKVDGEHGWGRYLQHVDVQICPGNHTTICEEPNVRVLASRLRAAIDAADTARIAVRAHDTRPASSEHPVTLTR
jgi:acyl transferase domain-containing protein/thioesterase domain-containing protein/aryl carrier-like protein